MTKKQIAAIAADMAGFTPEETAEAIANPRAGDVWRWNGRSIPITRKLTKINTSEEWVQYEYAGYGSPFVEPTGFMRWMCEQPDAELVQRGPAEGK